MRPRTVACLLAALLAAGGVLASPSAPAGAAATPARFVSVTPCRVVDTRVKGGAMANAVQRSYQITGTGSAFAAQGGKAGGCGVPVGATAVEATVSVVNPPANGYGRLWPAGQSMPTATFVNFSTRQSVTNTGTVGLATSGSTQLSLKNFGGATHYVIDIQGYFTTSSSAARYVSITPCRVLDTRSDIGSLASGATASFQVTGTGGAFATQGGEAGGCGIPVGAVGVEASVTALTPGAAGYARVWPAGQTLPTATFLNFTSGQSITNTGSIALATSGANQLSLRNAGGTAHFLVDIQGYFTTSSSAVASRFVGMTPCRVLDTRSGGGSIASGATKSFQVTGTGAAFATQGGKANGCTIPTGAVAVEASVTAVSPSTGGNIRLYRSDESLTETEFLNFTAKQSLTNTGTTWMATTGPTQLALKNLGGSSHFVVDVQGYYLQDPSTTTVPGAPTIGAATAGNGQASVSWTAPASTGGSAITGYVVTPYIGAAAQAALTFNSTATSQVVTGLTNGTAYTFKVAAKNAVGTGAQSSASNSVTPVAPLTVPGAPTGVTASAGDASASVSWSAPGSTGGSAITGYVVTPYVGSSAQSPMTFNSTATSQTVTGLANGTAYTFKVAAKNAVGTGAQSSASNAVTPTSALTVPGAPTAVSASAGDAQVTVSWSAPASTGGSAITGYVVTPFIGAAAQTPVTFNSTATSQTVTGLANGTAYTFKVAAKNAVGTGAQSSASNAATPVAAPQPPGAPTGVAADAGQGQAAIVWSAPASAGASPISGYVVTPFIGAAAQTPVTFNSTATFQIVTGLANGTAYTFKVAAKSAIGTGAQSAASNAVTPAALTPRGPTVAAGLLQACTVVTGGALKCWGDKFYGGLGGPLYEWTSTPGSVAGVSNVATVSASDDHTCVAEAAGTVKCWGENDVGQLGTGTTTGTGTPTAVRGIGGATSVSAGRGGGCAVTRGAVRCWGPNYAGQLGNGTTTASTIPVAVSGITDAVQVSAGLQHACAVLAGGSVRCWGSNDTGQLGDGTTTASSTPKTVPGISGATAVSAGTEQTCAIVAGGAVKCWGSNGFGELGNGSTTSSLVPVDVTGLTGAVQIDMDRWAPRWDTGHQVCAVLGNGTAKCWGGNTYGQLGNGAFGDQTTPTAVSGLTGATSIATGEYTVCAAIGASGGRCWGSGTGGRFGDAGHDSGATPIAVAVSPASSISAGGDHTCTRSSAGAVQCWGDAWSGALGDGIHPAPAGSKAPVTVSGLASPTAVTSGGAHTCAIVSGGAVKCWGSNETAQIGGGSASSFVPTATSVPGVSGAVALAAGGLEDTQFSGTRYGHTCALLTGGAVSCWGLNTAGQVGSGTTDETLPPTTISGLSGVTAVTSGAIHSCALLADTTVKCWGGNGFGQLGDDTTSLRRTPVSVAGLTGVIAIDAGGYQTCALLSGGAVKCWGRNAYGQLGDGTTTDRKVPVAVSSLSNVSSISVGLGHVCAVGSDAAVRCWGQTDRGQAGQVAEMNLVPAAVAGMTGAVAVSAGSLHTCAIGDSGTVKCWGDNFDGQYGDGRTSYSAVPVAVAL